MQDANWNYFDRITDDEFERVRAEHYEEEATEQCTKLQDLILARLRVRQNDARSDEHRTSARSEADLNSEYASIKSDSDEVRPRVQIDDECESNGRRCGRVSCQRTNERQRTQNDYETNTNERNSERRNEHRPSSTVFFRNSLPRLELETFTGHISDWPRWYSLFKSLVDDQPISNDEKMAHLQGAVTGLARHTIGGMLFDGDLYQDAIAALKDRFGRDEDIIHANLSRVFSAPSPAYLDPASLERFHGSIHCAVTVLQNMGYEGDLYSTENLRRAVQKLPPELKRDWGEYVIDIHKPNLIHFDRWLQRQVRIALNYAAVSTSTSRRTAVVPESQQTPRHMRSTLAAEASAFVPRDCACCETGVHQLSECPSFNQMSAVSRSKFVFNNRRCFSCLKKGHLARYCKFRAECGVKGCNQNHHTMLHDEEPEQENKNHENRYVAAVRTTSQTLLQIVPVRVH